MKKYIVGGALALLIVITPISAHADVVQDQYQAALVQLITLLQAQVADLMTQLMALQTKQAQVETKVDTIVQNTTPSFGAVVLPVEVDKSDILAVPSGPVTTQGVKPLDPNIFPYGYYVINIRVLDSKGKDTPFALVTMDAPDNWYHIYQPNGGDDQPRKTNSIKHSYDAYGVQINGADEWSTGFTYIPTQLGTRTVTFTSGSLSKTVTIEVK